jgi:hypothetical protein
MVYHYSMSKTNKILDQMRNNPRDWRIESLEAVAKRLGIKVRKPPGSHVIFDDRGQCSSSSPNQANLYQTISCLGG